MKHQEYLAEISNRVIQIFGLNYLPNQYIDLERRLIATAKELKIDTSLNKIYEWLSKPQLSHIEINALSANLTIGETYFFREKPALDLFVEKIIPDLIEQRKQNSKTIRIWCAGCSSGEEPYTLAIILKEHFPLLADWNVTILATDISPVAIQKALKGEYTDWSFREMTEEMKNKYFTSSSKLWQISSEIKKMVTFAFLNLSKNSYPSSLTNTDEMDVVFCRNVLMYFTPEIIKEVSSRFYNTLIKNGWFITSQVELNDEYFSDFLRVNYNKGIFYQKSDKPKEIIRSETNKNVGVTILKTIKKPVKSSVLKEIKKEKNPIKKQNNAKLTEISVDQLYQNGNYQLCITECLKKIENGNFSKEIFFILVKSYANSGQLIEGNKIIKKIIANESVTAEMYYLYASFLNEQNEIEEAENILKKAIYLNHNHILSHFMLGDILIKKGNFQSAKKQFETVRKLLYDIDNDVIIPESDGLTAGRIKNLAEMMSVNL